MRSSLRPNFDNAYFATVKSAKETSNFEMTGYEGDHLENLSGDNVQFFYVMPQRAKFNSIPVNLGEYFPNLEGLNLGFVGITTLTKNDLKQFPKLTYLNMKENEITTLSSDVFEFNPELNFINFKHNKLNEVGRDILRPIPKVFFVSFEKNPCAKDDVKAGKKEEFKVMRAKLEGCFRNAEFAAESAATA